MPPRAACSACQPSARILPTSSSLRGVPSGLLRSNTNVPRKPTIVSDQLARARAIVTSSPQPTLMISGES